MESESHPAPAGRGTHGRSPSHEDRRRVAMPRRPTRGPLEADFEDPLSATSSPVPHRQSSPSKAAARYNPRTASPTPSQASSLRSQTVPSGLSQQQQQQRSSRPSTEGTIGAGLKDYSYLTQPTNFHPLPAVSVVPPPFLQSTHQPPPNAGVEALLRGGHFRHAATAAATELSTSVRASLSSSSASGVEADAAAQRMFALWGVRLACLCLAGHPALAAQESKALGDLASSFYQSGVGGAEAEHAHAVPWELRVLAVRLQAAGFGDPRRGVMGCYELAREARHEAAVAAHAGRAAQREEREGRLRELGIRVADAAVEMGDLEAAGRHLESLRQGASADGGQTLRREAQQVWDKLRLYEALVWLRLGDIGSAQRCLAGLPEGSGYAAGVLSALIETADGDFEAAASAWRDLRSKHPDDALVGQNLAVCLIYLGQMAEAQELMVSLYDTAAAKSFQALSFNLATLYELCTEKAREQKIGMAIKDAARQPDAAGWERVAADYKL